MLLGSVLAVTFAQSTLALMACFVLMAVLYAVVYRYLALFGRFSRRQIPVSASSPSSSSSFTP
jgi:hypothetical protein